MPQIHRSRSVHREESLQEALRFLLMLDVAECWLRSAIDDATDNNQHIYFI